MKDAHATVWLALDLRDADWVPTSAAEYSEFWSRNVQQLVRYELRLNEVVALRDRRVGEFRIQVTQLPKGFQQTTAVTPFVIHSVLEPLRVQVACRCCASRGEPARHAPIFCHACAEVERANAPAAAAAPSEASPRLCVNHAVLLEGSLRAFCPAHAPRCDCGALARAFCFGPSCKKRSGVAFCQEHLRLHPNLANVQFCHACYEETFPRCLSPGCGSVATIRCSHWHRETQVACGRWHCAEHALRWQVYGPRDVGLARCREHADLSALTDPDVIAQFVASALLEGRHRLPSLQSVTHTLMRPRGQRYEITQVYEHFQRVRGELDATRPFERRMVALLDSHELQRLEDLKRDAQEKELGRPIFEALVAELRRRELGELAERVRFADFRPRTGVLYIRLDKHLRGRLIGTGHERHDELAEAIGARIEFEKDSR